MKCSLKNPNKMMSSGPRSVDLGDQIPHAMITETEGKAVVTIIFAFSMCCNSF
jgi:hypothetical protein